MGSKKRRKIPSAADVEVPAAFIEQMEAVLGREEAAELARALNASPSVSLRLNRRKVADTAAFMQRFAEYGVTPVEWCESGFYLDRRPDFNHDPLLHAGAYYVQEAASMFYETAILKVTDGEKYGEGNPLALLDLCAAPGGKSTAILNGVARSGVNNYVLVANEFDRGRAKILKENLEKWGDPNVIVTNSPTSRFEDMGEVFDIVCVDAPCSGEGMMRREPVARSQWGPGLVEQCAALQREILADAVSCLRPGGVLIYSTCTFNTLENEANADRLQKEFSLEPIDEPRRFMPHRERCEGLYVAIFRKPADTAVSPHVKYPADMAKRIEKAGIRVVSAGIELETRKGEKVLPSSRKVLAFDYGSEEYPEIKLSREEAVAYLRGNALVLPEGTPAGYCMVSYCGFPLGLVKNIGSRANNLYPPEWRLAN